MGWRERQRQRSRDMTLMNEQVQRRVGQLKRAEEAEEARAREREVGHDKDKGKDKGKWESKRCLGTAVSALVEYLAQEVSVRAREVERECVCERV